MVVSALLSVDALPATVAGSVFMEENMTKKIRRVPIPADVYDECLECCNAIRAAKKMTPMVRLPPGNSHSEMSCPCGKSTSVPAGQSYWRKEKYMDWRFPKRFVELFDKLETEWQEFMLPVRSEA